MSDEDTERFGELFPSSRSGIASKPKETLSLPLWKDIDLTFKDVFGVSEERRDEAIHRYNVLEFLIERYGKNFSKKEIDDAFPSLKEKFGSTTPSASSIYRYWRTFKKSDFQLSSLIPKVTAGNTSKNVPEELEPLIQEAIKDYFSAEEQTAACAYLTLETEVSSITKLMILSTVCFQYNHLGTG